MIIIYEVGVVPPRGYCKYWNIATHTTKVEMDYYKINPTERERERESIITIMYIINIIITIIKY